MEDCVVVTGAGRGIGRATAERLACDGRIVVGLDIRLPEAGMGAGIELLTADLTGKADLARAFEEISRRYRVVGLVNNAGTSRMASLEQTSDDDIAACWQLNIVAMIHCTQAALPAMKQARRGRIVNISSRTALGKELRTAYAATKGGVISMTRVWALELAPLGITVNAIAPGPIATELFRAVNPEDAPATQRLIKSVPVGRLGQPEDIANAVAFFLDERSGFVTGQVLYVCGGMSVGVAPV